MDTIAFINIMAIALLIVLFTVLVGAPQEPAADDGDDAMPQVLGKRPM